MQRTRWTATVVLTLLAVLALTAAWGVYAQDGGSEAPGSRSEVEPPGSGPVSAEPTGNAPDEDGYTGDVAAGTAESGDGSSEDKGPDSEPPDWDRFFSEPQPDQNEYYVGKQDVDAQWSDLYYRYVAGSTLRPRTSTTGWGWSGGGGCIYATSDSGAVFNIHVALPAGSRVDYLRLYYYDASASYSQAWFTRYDGTGGYSDRATVSSSGSSGYGTTLSAYVGDVLDDPNYSYVLNWRPNVAGSTMMLCGLRIAYRMPALSVFLPAVLKN
jgi:hypothetical protein